MKTTPYRWNTMFVALVAACSLAACGGGGSGSSSPDVVTSPPATDTTVVAPTATGNIVIDGREWFNYRRAQIGMSKLTESTIVDRAAQNHSDYQRLNNTISHDEKPGLSGFTGVTVQDRLSAAGFPPLSGNYALGEVISASSSNSGFFMADELITAIYHRFVVFEPVFKEIGTGSGTTSAKYTYFTADFAANNGFGPGLGNAVVANWPYSGQTGVTTNFFSDQESPDPVPTANEVGYPVSVHADINAVLTVDTFTIHPRGGANLQTKLLVRSTADQETPLSAAAIVPLAPLMAGTTYDVTFSGTWRDGRPGAAPAVPINKTWSFTTK